MKQSVVLVLLVMALATPVAVTATGAKEAATPGPVKITMFYSDNATLPFKADWLTVVEAQKRVKAQIQWEIIPIADYKTKVSLALNSGANAPDVILYQTTKAENAALALNGAIVPISDYSSFTPYHNAMVQKYGLQSDVDMLKLKDGKRYFMPALFDVPFYDGGLILREDLLTKYGLKAPKTFDDLYNVLKTFKQNAPDSFPLTWTFTRPCESSIRRFSSGPSANARTSSSPRARATRRPRSLTPKSTSGESPGITRATTSPGRP